MLFSVKIPFHVAARLTVSFWVPHCYDLPLFATIHDCSPLFGILETIGTICTIRYSGLFAVRYLQLFATIRYSGSPDTCLHARQGSSSTRGSLSTYPGTQPGEVAF